MAIQTLEYWYDGQQRRFLEQVVRAFSGFQYLPGIMNGVQQALRMVPCRMASQDRMVTTITQNNSENTLLAVPMITVSQTGLTGRRDDVQFLAHVDTLQATERSIVNGSYTGSQGNNYTVQRIMPRPFDMKLEVSLWTSNQDQKYQLMEQILVIMYPTFQIQNSENGLDWTASTLMHLEDIAWTSRSVSVGTDSDIDITTINLRLPIWLSAPAKVKTQKIIETIITNVYQGAASNSSFGEDGLDQGPLLTRDITTPGNLHISISGNSIQLLNARGGSTLTDGSLPNWAQTIGLYGTLSPGVSQILLTLAPNDITGPYVSGTIQLDPNNVNQLMWQLNLDSLPGNTLPAISGVIDPTATFPGNKLPTPVIGNRYLLLEAIGPATQAWGVGFSAEENDIIQYTSTGWVVSFAAANNATSLDHVLNLMTGSQLRWTGSDWVMSIDGIYGPAYWHLAL